MANDVKFHSWKNLAAHESAYNKEQMEAIGYDGMSVLCEWSHALNILDCVVGFLPNHP